MEHQVALEKKLYIYIFLLPASEAYKQNDEYLIWYKVPLHAQNLYRSFHFLFLLVTPQMITILYVGYVEAQIGSVSGPPLSLQASYGWTRSWDARRQKL